MKNKKSSEKNNSQPRLAGENFVHYLYEIVKDIKDDLVFNHVQVILKELQKINELKARLLKEQDEEKS